MRTRSLAPGFWKNPELARCDAHARLMFAALWGLADRAGRLEDRPDKIRAEAFPFEPNVDPDSLLWQLHSQGLAVRYLAATGQALIEVLRFTAFQRPYTHESPSLWPGLHDEGSKLRTPNDPLPIGGRELRLSTVSCLLSPVSLPLAGEVAQLAIDGIGPPLKSALNGKPNRKKQTPNALVMGVCPHELIVRLWRETLPAMPAPASPWGGTAEKYLRARWRAQAEHDDWASASEGLAWFKSLFRYVARSRFLTGRTGPRRLHETPFEITLEWLVKHEHWIKVQQGQYHDKGEGAMR